MLSFHDRLYYIFVIYYNFTSAVLLMYMLGSALWVKSISLIEVEILFLSHALWYGVIVAVTPPTPTFWLFALINPHTYLYVGVVLTAYDLPRPICYLFSAVILMFGLYRRWYQVPLTCYNKPILTIDDYAEEIKKL